jgi:hypothetical protein
MARPRGSPLVPVLAATPLQGGAELVGRGDGPAVTAGVQRAAFFAPRPVNVRFDQVRNRVASRSSGGNPLKIKEKGWWAH